MEEAGNVVLLIIIPRTVVVVLELRVNLLSLVEGSSSCLVSLVEGSSSYLVSLMEGSIFCLVSLMGRSPFYLVSLLQGISSCLVIVEKTESVWRERALGICLGRLCNRGLGVTLVLQHAVRLAVVRTAVTTIAWLLRVAHARLGVDAALRLLAQGLGQPSKLTGLSWVLLAIPWHRGGRGAKADTL